MLSTSIFCHWRADPGLAPGPGQAFNDYYLDALDLKLYGSSVRPYTANGSPPISLTYSATGAEQEYYRLPLLVFPNVTFAAASARRVMSVGIQGSLMCPCALARNYPHSCFHFSPGGSSFVSTNNLVVVLVASDSAAAWGVQRKSNLLQSWVSDAANSSVFAPINATGVPVVNDVVTEFGVRPSRVSEL